MANPFESVRQSVTSARRRPTLAQRRRRRTLRHLAIAISAGLCVFMALETFAANTATHTVVVAARPLASGNTLSEEDVTLRSVAENSLWAHAPSTLDAVTGQVLQLDVQPGEPIFTSMLSQEPTVPEGFTSIAVNLASTDLSLATGMTVSLVASALPDCPEDTTASTAACTVSDNALVMEPATTDDLTGATSQVFAMHPDDAVAVLAAEKVSDIMVVSHAD